MLRDWLNRFEIPTNRLWPAIAVAIFIGFLLVAGLLAFLGERSFASSSDNVLDQRLLLAEIAADEIDSELTRAVSQLEEVSSIVKVNSSGGISEETAAIATRSIGQLETFRAGVVLLDSSGSVLSGYPEKVYSVGDNLTDLSFFTGTLKNSEPTISNPFVDPIFLSPVVAISVPVLNNGEIAGVIIGHFILSSEELITPLLRAKSLGDTAHAVLIDSRGRVLNSTFQLPFLSLGEHFTFYREAYLQGEPVIETVPFELDLPNEPEGHLHVMAYVPLDNAPWGVSVGGDLVEETFGGILQDYRLLAAYSLIGLVAALIFTLTLTRRLLKPVQTINRQVELNHTLASTNSLNEVSGIIIKFVSDSLGSAYSILWVFDDNGSRFIRSGMGGSFIFEPPEMLRRGSLDLCTDCINSSRAVIKTLNECTCDPLPGANPDQSGLCLPLTYDNSTIGMLHIFPSSADLLTNNNINLLTAVAPEMALAIHNALLDRTSRTQLDASKAERLSIARNLHDTLGADLAYLRLKMDAYSGEDVLFEISDIKNDMEKMRGVVEEAYTQVRGTLESLRGEPDTYLVAAFTSLGDKVAARSGFNFQLISHGQDMNISGETHRQLLYIFRETLNNIEQHADAKNVEVDIRWGDRDLTIIVKDDGKGFALDKINNNAHFGLKIMNERARLLGGTLKIFSNPGEATEVQIWAPIIQEQPP